MSAVLHAFGGEGPALLMIHGFGGDHLTWLPLTPFLRRAFTLYALDLPGHGKASNDVGAGRIADLAQSAIAAMPQRPMALMGHSMGGAVALEMARRGAADKLVLLAPAGLGTETGAPPFVRRFAVMTDADEAALVLNALAAGGRNITPQMARYVLDALEQPGRRAALGQIAAGLDHLSRARPSVPSAVIWGASDEIDPSPAPFGDFHLLPGTGHLPHVERAADVARIARGHLLPPGALV